PEASVTIFYIDIRTISRHENFYYDLLNDDHVKFIKGKVAKVEEDPGTKNLSVDVEDTLSGQKIHADFDLVVLAVGVVPNTAMAKLPVPGVTYDEYGFVVDNENTSGIIAAGCAKRPADVSRSVKDATGAALKAIQSL
ncbi:MAG: heterodisulfide reductase subunit A, partial [bacterium]